MQTWYQGDKPHVGYGDQIYYKETAPERPWDIWTYEGEPCDFSAPLVVVNTLQDM